MTRHTDGLRRDVLPIPDPQWVGLTTYDVKDPDTTFPPITPVRPPHGAPNVLLILIDYAGFGSSSAFGGPCSTPTFERLAADGLRYTRFHTTALCSPTRAALLSGRNHHSVGMGGITEIATSAPGYSSVRPKNKAPVAETLKLNGYSTAHFGKCHEVPVWETSPMGPFERWPSPGNGFEHFYGFIGGETNQYAPALYRDTVPVEPDRTPEEGYHFTEDMTDRSIEWIRQQKALMPDKPFFVYYAPGATHAPHHVPAEWSDRYAGRFDQGWDALREETFARQLELGVVGPDAELTARPAEIPAWDGLPDDLKPVLARQMEVYAGFMEHTDHHVGRLLDALEADGILDDTLVICIVGDNGASAEGDLHGCFNELINLNGANALQTTEFMASRIDAFGTPAAYNHYAVGWAHAMDTPYQWTKQVASHFGGTRNGTIVRWPRGIQARELRHQFHHVIDVVPTILEAAGLPHPSSVNGIQQAPIEGRSMAYTFDDAGAADRRTTQYFEMVVNRGIYHQGWTAVTRHSLPWDPTAPASIDADVWELYGPDDWTQAHDLAAEQPDMLAKLQRLFLIEATKYNVLPLADRRVERFNADLAGRPQLIRGSTQLLFGGMGRLTENSLLVLKNKSYAVSAEFVVPEGGANGTIVAQGGAFGGWSLYLLDGRPAHCYNLFGLQRFKVYGPDPISAGEHQVRVEFAYDGGGLGKGGTVTLYVDGTRVGEGRVEGTVPMVFSADETADVGNDSGTPVTDDLPPNDARFTGRVRWVQLDIDEAAEDHDHLVTAEERYKIAMARQ
ncbi:MAG: sulfatase-like hydrolase/transferase [Jiangellaceae bacterium]